MNVFLDSFLDLKGIFQFLIVLVMIRATFPLKVSPRLSALYMLLVTSGFTLTNGTFNLLGQIYLLVPTFGFCIYVFLMLLFSWLYSNLALRIAYAQSMTTLLFFLSNLLVVYMIVGSFCSLYCPNPQSFETILSSTILILLAILYRKTTHSIYVKLPISCWLMVYLTSALITLFIIIMWNLSLAFLELLPIGMALLTLDFAVYYLFMQVAIEMEHQIQLALDNQNLAFQNRQMDNVQTMLESTRRARHELKNNYFMIESLVEQGQYDAVLKYLREVIAPSFAKEEMVSTGNHFLDMVLSQKVGEARQNHIPIALNVQVPEHISISQQLLCSLLFNMIDNAIEASKLVTEPDIRLSIHVVKGYLSVDVRNRINHSVLENNPKLKTSKHDSSNHGIGISMIRQVVQACDGELQIFETDDYFVVRALLAMTRSSPIS